jgi:Tol biopolymer transport system component
MKTHRSYRLPRYLSTSLVIFTLGSLLVSLASFPVKAVTWGTPIQLTFNMDIADNWGGPSISADGSKIVFKHNVDGYYQVFVANTDGSGVTQVTHDQRNYVHLSISGDGSKIAVSSYAPGSYSNSEAFVINADGTGMTSLVTRSSLSCKPAISADGTKVAVIASSQEGQSEVFVVNSDGTGLRQLTNNTLSVQYVSISGDGSKIAFSAYTETAMEIFVADSDGTITQITNSTYSKYNPSISGDGSKIVFESQEYYSDGENYTYMRGIGVVNSDGTGFTYAVNNTAVNMQPSINYDGSKIAFSSYEETYSSFTQASNPEIFVVNSDGTGLTQITQSEKRDSYPSICSDGSRISFISFDTSTYAGEIYVIADIALDSKAPVTADNYDGQWRTAAFRINLTATDDMSGIAETYYKINNGATQSLKEAGQPVIRTEGANNKLEYWSIDVAGNEESPQVLTDIKLDTTAPTGSITINNDNASTYTNIVTLTLSAEDNFEVTQMHFRNNETAWTAWETYSTSKNWTVPLGEGAKTVYVQFKDTAGLVSTYYSDAIMLEIPEEPPEDAFPTTLILAGVAVAVAVVAVAAVLIYLKKKR